MNRDVPTLRLQLEILVLSLLTLVNGWCVPSLTLKSILALISRMTDQIALANPPFDSISSVRFSPANPDHLLVTAWDGVRISLLLAYSH
jgi:hypothetical protein